MPDLIGFLPERVFTLTGPVAGASAATVEFFLSGTTTPATVYQDDAASVAHEQPIAANANGTFPKIVGGASALKAVIKTSSGATIATVDPCWRSPLTGSGASSITFAPTDEIIATDVQSALEYVAAYFSEFGRTLVDDATAADARVTLGLGAAMSGSSLAVDNANNATSTGFYTLTSPFTNGPTAAGYRFLTIRANADEMTQIATLSASAAIWYRIRTSGAWGAWVRITDTTSLRTELNATGAAPIYACRAWVNFNGTGTVAIRASGNVSSITDNGTGLFTVNFATNMPDANYAVVITGGNEAGAGTQFATLAGAPAAGSVQVGYHLTGTGPADAAHMNVAIFR